MTILLYKNGQWLIDGEQPLEGVSLDNLAAILTNPKDGDIVKYDESSGMWVAGDSPLPAVTSSDNGKVLGVADGAWAKLGGGGSLPPVAAADNGKVLAVEDGAWAAGMQEYWIPVEAVGTTLSIPADKEMEVALALNNAAQYFVRGIKIGTILYAGYVENTGAFIVPLTKSDMSSLGYDCAGKIHIVFDTDLSDYVVKVEPDKFIVALTPTALDYSGTMDKTVAEINAAYEAGQEIVFRVYMVAETYNEVDCTIRFKDGDYPYPSFNAYLVDSGNNVFIFAWTGTTDNGTKQTYSTTVYSLTPAS